MVVTVVAAVFYKELIHFLLRPILDSVGCADRSRRQVSGVPCADMTVNGLIAPFSIALKVSLMSGVGRHRRSGSTSCGPSWLPACTPVRGSTRWPSSAPVCRCSSAVPCSPT
ncbi:hypothetical protein QQY66_00045 [Streptomyces sp. DG2A-72]|uniref:hypothetical protein n=1 Tax=Streptomyces sp. DG2A-72 TaxID=3051386 RepID=UPI00265C5C52|nr:hypothetical protein [Streptomyces sp. DG2A-72]MDO0930189.1 hypothetical protein [Streptomyces sp. DG2A-72]